MSSNPADILQEKMQAFIKKCPRIAGRYAVAHFQDNIRKRGGVPVNGSLKRFEPRGFDEPGPRRAILLKTGNLSDAIKIIHEASTWVSVGISERRIKRYARCELLSDCIFDRLNTAQSSMTGSKALL